MLILAIILGVLGAVLVYIGRPRERAIVWVGFAVLLAALVIFVIWLVGVLDSNGVDTALILLP